MGKFHQDKIAIVYDFDKTLSPRDMQEFGIFDHIGMTPQQFWGDVKAERDETKAEELLVYMRKMIHEGLCCTNRLIDGPPLSPDGFMLLPRFSEYPVQ